MRFEWIQWHEAPHGWVRPLKPAGYSLLVRYPDHIGECSLHVSYPDGRLICHGYAMGVDAAKKRAEAIFKEHL